MKVEISNGELLDKITILKLKLKYVSDPERKKHVINEHDDLVGEMMALTDTIEDKSVEQEYLAMFDKLMEINDKLWLLEDRIRDKEKRKIFDQDFIEIARSIYHVNDERAAVKREINDLTSSSYVEVKSYSEYN